MQLAKPQDELFTDLRSHKYPDECKNLVRKHLSPDLYNQLKDKKTALGGTLGHAISPAVLDIKSSIGFMVSDPEAYEVFAPLADLIIKDYHKLPMDQPVSHPPTAFGDIDNLPFGDLGSRIVSTRIRVGRTFEGFAMVTQITKDARLEMEKKVQTCLESVKGEHKGTYYKLSEMSDATKKQLVMDHFMFNDKEDHYLEVAGAYRDWPAGRGIYHNDKKTFLVWNNEEDHLRIISMEPGGNIARVYKRLVEGVRMLEKAAPFARSDKLGWLTSCPTNLGTAMRASVHAKVPLISANKAEFEALCEKYGIQPRGIHGENSESEGGVYDLSNKRRLGITELDAVKIMAEGVKVLLEREAELEKAGKKGEKKA